jgi:chromosome segregation ATPase
VRAVWARKKAQQSIRTLLHGDQRLLDSVLRDLGRAAREAEVQTPAIEDEMRRVREQEERRANADRQSADAEASMHKEEERWRIDQGERDSDLSRREVEIKIAEEDLRARAEERRAHDMERAKAEAAMRAAERRAQGLDAKAAKADVTPPEKGGGPNTAANLRAQAAEARKEANSIVPTRDAAVAEIEKLEGPIAELTKRITDGRATVVQKKKELAEAKAIHEKALQDLQAARERAAGERDAAERELTQRFVTAGTILNLNRVDHPKLAPIFARVDQVKAGVTAREAAIVRLESERRLYDRGAVQKGLLTLGIALGVLVLGTIILLVLLAR